MQPEQSQRNVTQFLIACFVIFTAWIYIEFVLFPKTPRPTRSSIAAARASATVPLSYLSGHGGIGDAAILTTSLAVAYPPSELGNKPGEPDKKPTESNKKPEEVAQGEPKPVVKPNLPVKVVTLGDPSYNLQAKFTSKGGAVESVILTQFQQADRLGLPVTENGAPQPLHLIPGGGSVPSFATYLYEKPGDPRPSASWGEAVWEEIPAPADLPEQQKVAFRLDVPERGLRVTKIYTLNPTEYHIGLRVNFERLPDAKDSSVFRYQLAGPRGLPIEGEWYTTTYRNAIVGWVDSYGYPCRYFETSTELNFKMGGNRLLRDKNTFDYAAVAVQYFASAILIDDQQAEGVKRNFVEFARATQEVIADKTKPFLDDITVRCISEEITLAPGQSLTHQYLIYNGPVKTRLLRQMGAMGKHPVPSEVVDRYDRLHLYTLTDYQMANVFGDFSNAIGWTWLLIFVTNIMHSLLGLLMALPYINLGIALILLTVLVRCVLFPLSLRQTAVMHKFQLAMTKLQPQFKELEKKFGPDHYALQRAKSELMIKSGVNPAAPLGGCLLIFLQMPIFMGLYYALSENVFFRLDRFLWMPNLAAPDMLIWWTESIPFISRFDDIGWPTYLGPYLNILPIIAVVLMLVQQKYTMPPPADEQQAAQQQTMKIMMGFMGLLFYKVPAGLTMYFILSTAWALVERRFLPKTPTGEESSTSTSQPDAGDDKGDGGRPKKPRGKGPKGGKGKGTEPAKQPSKLRSWWDEVLKEAAKKNR